MARTRPGPVSMLPSRVSPIFRDTIWAPGATPSRSGLPGWWPATMPATWVPWAPASHTTESTAPPSYTFTA